MTTNHQELRFGGIRLNATRENDVLFFLSGKRMYEIGEVSAKYPPIGWRRPGFLAGKRISEVGPEDPRRPDGAAHLLREMGGLWAHPVKAIESIYFSIETDADSWLLVDNHRFVSHFAYAEFFFERHGLSVVRTDFVHEEDPLLFIRLRIANRRPETIQLRLLVDVEPNLMPSWFSGWPNGDDITFFKDGLLFAYDRFWPGQWGLVAGSSLTPSRIYGRTIEDPKTAGLAKKVQTLEYSLEIPAHRHAVVPFLISADSRGGYPEAHERFIRNIDQGESILKSKVASYEKRIPEGVQFECSDKWFTTAYQVAKANLVILMCDLSPFVGPYLYAGIPEYVQLFGTDTAYSIPGMVSAGFRDAAREALSQLGFKATTQCGRVPHEVTTNGRIFHPGNTQETAQYCIACWEYLKWTGDRSFLEWVYPLCQEGVLDYSPAHWDTDLDYYLDGNSMVERPGMGEEKLDSVTYFDRAIFALADMATALGRPAERARYLELAQLLQEAINEDFWMESESLFADSLEEDHTQKMDGHWIVAVPMEADIAARDKGHRALRRIEQDWVNEWGMVHTREREELVWTLPTGVLAMAEFNYGHADLGTWLLRNIARTMEHGALGTFKELIPEGLSFVQLWSSAMFLRGVTEGIFRFDPQAFANSIKLRPRLPKDWTYARLRHLVVGNHEVTIDFADARQGIPTRTTITHDAGPAALSIILELPASQQLPVQVKAEDRRVTKEFARDDQGEFLRLSLSLEPQQQAEVILGQQIEVTIRP